MAKSIVATSNGWLYSAKLDRRFVIQGVASGPPNSTLWTLPIKDPTVTIGIFGPEYANAGESFPVSPVNGTDPTELFAYGVNATAYPCILGRAYSMDIDLSPQFARDRNGNAMSGGTLSLRRLVTVHTNTGEYDVMVTYTPASIRPSRVTAFNKLDGSGDETIVEGHGRHITFIQGDSEHVLVSLQNSSPRPCHINSVTFEGDYSSVGDLAQVS